MSLHKYTSWAFQIAEELRDTVSDEDADVLREEIRQMGESGWLTWVEKNDKAIHAILGATPEKRIKRKEWADAVQRRRLCFAAYYKGRLAGLTLSVAEQLGPGGSYRSTCQSAAFVGEELIRDGRWFWPFGGKPPFDSWQPPADLDYSVSVSCAISPGGQTVSETRVCGIRVDDDPV